MSQLPSQAAACDTDPQFFSIVFVGNKLIPLKTLFKPTIMKLKGTKFDQTDFFRSRTVSNNTVGHFHSRENSKGNSHVPQHPLDSETFQTGYFTNNYGQFQSKAQGRAGKKRVFNPETNCVLFFKQFFSSESVSFLNVQICWKRTIGKAQS